MRMICIIPTWHIRYMLHIHLQERNVLELTCALQLYQPLIQDIALLRYEVMPGTIKRITDISGTLKAILFGMVQGMVLFWAIYSVKSLLPKPKPNIFLEQFLYKWFSVNI